MSAQSDNNEAALIVPDPEEAAYAEIIIPLALPRNYTWYIPSEFRPVVQPGVRVEVELRQKKYAGIVQQLVHKKPEAFSPKPILNVLDEEPIVYEKQLTFWQWMAHYYMCTQGEVMQAAIPANFKLTSESILQFNETTETDPASLSNDEFMIYEALEIKRSLKMNEVQQVLDKAHVYPVVKKLLDKKICFIYEHLVEKFKPKTETYVTLHPQFRSEEKLELLLNTWSKAPKQLALLLSFLHLSKESPEVKRADLLKKSNATAQQLKALTEKQILLVRQMNVDRIPQLPASIHIDFELSDAQQKAIENIQSVFKEKEVCLLHGVTASGKTQIYARLMETQLKAGKQVLYMLPEIALTAQLIRRLQKYFGGHIIVYHSRFNPHERVEIWNRVKSGQASIVLGARSALFLPFQQLSLIIVDEEHDPSYKQQDPAPRYQGRDAAIYLSTLTGARVLLGSATPSLETLYNADKNKYGKVVLEERFGKVNLPTLEIIDLKRIVQKEKGRIMLSPQLKAAINDSLNEKKQVILFQNRRGYAPYFICGACGWIPTCTDCAVTLTFHKSKNQLCCHYCGKTYPVLYTCGACGSHQFLQKNFGTEKIEEQLAEAFPQAHISRMDYDSVKGKYDHDNLIRLFEQQKIDILVGTQMVIKGLDFDQVNLVGILDADSLLAYADFRVNERAFQMMQQVSGRAGRKDGVGKVLIQTLQPKHPILLFLQQQETTAFYRYELADRKRFHYPPFTRVIKISFKHKENEVALEAASRMEQGLRLHFKDFLSGPAAAIIPRIRNKYIWEILLKLPRDGQVIDHCKREIQQQAAIIFSNKRLATVIIQPDVDPL